MHNHTCCLREAINKLILCSLLIGAPVLAQDHTYTAAQIGPAAISLNASASNDCYNGGRNGRLMLRINDLSALWHYATGILRPSASAGAAPSRQMEKRKPAKGVDWRVGSESGGVLVSGNLAW